MNHRKVILLAMAGSAWGVLLCCSCSPQPGPPEPPQPGPSTKSPDLIVADMYFTPGGGSSEFPAYDLHVVVKNVGKAVTKSNKIIVKVWHDESSTQGIRFRPLVPVASVLGNLNPGQSAEAVWENVSVAGRAYFLGVVDIPTRPHFPLGQEKELPIKTAEKNNTLAIPAP